MIRVGSTCFLCPTPDNSVKLHKHTQLNDLLENYIENSEKNILK